MYMISIGEIATVEVIQQPKMRCDEMILFDGKGRKEIRHTIMVSDGFGTGQGSIYINEHMRDEYSR